MSKRFSQLQSTQAPEPDLVAENRQLLARVEELETRQETSRCADIALEAAAFYRDLFEDAPIAFWLLDGSEMLRELNALMQAGIGAGLTSLEAHLSAYPEAIERALTRLRVLDVNRAARKLYGATENHELLGTYAERLDPASLAAWGPLLATLFRATIFRAAGDERAEGRVEAEAELEVWTLSGETRSVLARVIVPEESATRLDRLILAEVDITRRVRAERALKHLARTDGLTGLANRRFFMERAEAEVVRARRYNHGLGVLILDADHFKKVNDTYGHAAGDAVLRALAKRARSVVRSVDLLGRLGGEEFGLLMPETDLPEIRAAAERLRQEMARAPVPSGETGTSPIAFTVSIGMASLTEQDASFEAVLHRADLALYEAKESGRNTVRG